MVLVATSAVLADPDFTEGGDHAAHHEHHHAHDAAAADPTAANGLTPPAPQPAAPATAQANSTRP